MRITRDLLHRIAADTVETRAKQDPSIIAAYLHGTVLEGPDPVLGGAADIDLVFIHDQFERSREIIRMTEDVHLDIEHHSKDQYQPAKELRTRPWLGFAIYQCKLLHDPEHFLDFTQASVRGMFFQFENVLARAEELHTRSRAAWLHFHNQEVVFGPEQVMAYLQAVQDAINAAACLYGPPLGGRRFLFRFKLLSEERRITGLYDQVAELVSGGMFPDGHTAGEEAKGWMLEWADDLTRLNENYEVPPELHRHRKAYFMRGFEAMLASDDPETFLWPLLTTWTRMAGTMPSQAAAWAAVCERIGLTGEKFERRLVGLDRLLDQIEVMIEKWEPGERGLLP